MIDGILIFWFILTGLSLIYVTYDLIKVTPEANVMKWGWWLVTLYSGPAGLFLYLLSCKEPMQGTHEAFTADHWKQSVGSMVHCLAGDVTGIILAAIILAFVKVSLPVEITIEYIAGFACGLLIFQSLFMKGMMGGSYTRAMRISFYPEFTSMNTIMAGMIPVMVIWTLIEPSAASPSSLHFWGKMSLATIVAGLTAYPMNSWLVKRGLKHGMMTVRDRGEFQLPEGKVLQDHSKHDSMQMPKPQRREMGIKCVLSLIALGIGVLLAICAWVISKS